MVRSARLIALATFGALTGCNAQAPPTSEPAKAAKTPVPPRHPQSSAPAREAKKPVTPVASAPSAASPPGAPLTPVRDKPEAVEPSRPPLVVEPPRFTVPPSLAQRQKVDDRYPFPQNTEKAKALREERRVAANKASVGVFDTLPGAKAPWAAAARRAMEANAARLARTQSKASGVEYQEFHEALKAAVEAGCDDPLVEYWHVRFVLDSNPDRGWDPPASPARQIEWYRKVLARLPNTPYPPSVRVHMAWNTFVYFDHAEKKASGTLRKGELEAAEAAFWKVFRELAREKDRLSQQETVDRAVAAVSFSHDRGLGWEAGWRAADKVLAEAKAPEWVRLSVEGAMLIEWAWEARGRGFANTVTPEGARLLVERLEKARGSLARAWELQPNAPDAARWMIPVAMGLSLDRDEMEKWFRRAMEADPDNEDACRAKMEWLQPRWYGSREDVLEFQGQCYRTQNWYAHIPLLLDETVDERDLQTLAGPKNAAYFRDRRVWDRIRAGYEGYLTAYPDDRWVRTRYAILCVAAGQRAAATQFEALKGRPWTFAFPDRQTYEDFLRRAGVAGK
ncbi:wd repeat-containing transcriptional regulator : Uncharacterized protein OS=Pedosphaera parvula (strain Ellin514) GN=Cflav_PD4949 PE=4 SV=1 [Gemmataceae bacterium]|nr:wd repeat-containing transcriptional regulator : Uncharacterized protein OS=Pedosphaera parvula (strain Ellin514) GN=Cflav_PD4949 PE=4 SV=1 [Gemmataceae bacterium]VTU02238.1 wd repeat-containing transcriptional regulator : Uncharacterized protein OS=Pedosphaera parvula (strain Ellin514) GN=Cflav_PD4949 PE=4 SV=1 [Gemmataceae bacterium]